MNAKLTLAPLFLVLLLQVDSHGQAQPYVAQGGENYRPQLHFTPKQGWMNDPNGMFFYNNQYHLYYQYYPYSSVWGPMHWGHATSTDLVHWQHRPTALFPDSLGYIFSGSTVVDSNNTSGFGKDGKVPMVAVFTHHDVMAEKSGKREIQTQSIAYSLDEGITWTKYSNNPVLKNPGLQDFRDPKVSWYAPSKKWIMTLAASDRVHFYSSPDLKNWTKESEYGTEVGKHGAAWECPDLFQLKYNDENIWVLLVSINPGGPNGGSATQYFTGDFDGKNFTSLQKMVKWLDYGKDNYAGVTWFNTGDRKIFMGWMSNWDYGQFVPTKKWRSAMTVPRDLRIEKVANEYLVTSLPLKELNSIAQKPFHAVNVSARNYDVTGKTGKLQGPARISFNSDAIETFSVVLSNDLGEEMVVGYNREANYYYADRSNSGIVNFAKEFPLFHYAPRLTASPAFDFTLIIDRASIEFFADNGLTVMTEIFFPNKPYNQIRIRSEKGILLKKFEYSALRSIWSSSK